MNHLTHSGGASSECVCGSGIATGGETIVTVGGAVSGAELNPTFAGGGEGDWGAGAGAGAGSVTTGLGGSSVVKAPTALQGLWVSELMALIFQ